MKPNLHHDRFSHPRTPLPQVGEGYGLPSLRENVVNRIGRHGYR